MLEQFLSGFDQLVVTNVVTIPPNSPEFLRCLLRTARPPLQGSTQGSVPRIRNRDCNYSSNMKTRTSAVCKFLASCVLMWLIAAFNQRARERPTVFNNHVIAMIFSKTLSNLLRIALKLHTTKLSLPFFGIFLSWSVIAWPLSFGLFSSSKTVTLSSSSQLS